MRDNIMDCCEKTLDRIASDIALHLTETNITALIECERGLMHEVVSHPHRGGRGHYVYYNRGAVSVNQIKILHRMGAIADDRNHPEGVKYTGMGADYINYYKLSALGKLILKHAASWYEFQGR